MNIKETVARVFRKGGNDDEQQPAPDALELIRSDHREVDELFAKALGDDTPTAQRRAAIAKICEALTIHAEMEEALFYPALRKAGGAKEKDSVLEANEEHGVVKDLIAKIELTPPGDETVEAKVTVLKELVHHHVKEEESEIFGEARKALGEERLQQLGEEMQRFKQRAQRSGRDARPTGGDPRYASAKKTAARRSSAKKSSAKKSSERSSTAEKSAAKRPVAKKTSAKKSSAKKTSSKKSAGSKTGGKKTRR